MNMTLVDKTQNEIKDMILNKEYNEAGYLPSEGELCSMLSVSRATVREAVRSMEVRGFVKRIHGKGILVVDSGIKVVTQSITDMFDKTDIDLYEILEVRRVIEIPAASFAAERACPEMLDKIENCIIRMERTQPHEESYIVADLEFHLNLVAASGNKTLWCITSAYTPLLQKLIYASVDLETNIEKKHHYHRNIYDALVSREPEKAAEKMREHLLVTEHNSGIFRQS